MSGKIPNVDDQLTETT